MQDQTLPEGLKKIIHREGLLQESPSERLPPVGLNDENPCDRRGPSGPGFHNYGPSEPPPEGFHIITPEEADLAECKAEGIADADKEIFAADRRPSKDEMDRAVDDIKASLDLLVAAHRRKDRKRIFYRIGQLSRLMVDLGRKCADLPPLPDETDLVLPGQKDIIV